MKDIKKLMITLALLITAVGGAWAQGYNVTFGGFSESEMNTTVNVASLPQTFTTIGHDALYPWTVISTSGNIFYNATVTSGGEGKVSANIANDEEMTITITGPFEGTATIHVTGEDDENRNISTDITVSCEAVGGTAEPSGPDVAWDKDKKTGTFNMPGGNVTLEPEYYPQAALTAAPTAINDVPATTDGAIVKAGTVANIGESTNAQGTVMYYVSPSALDDAALLALAADAWKADVPTAAHLTAGEAHVYYYVRGNDSDTDDENFSDGDILAANALTVTIAAEPTYAVTFAEGTDLNEWSASPNAGVTKGQQVTVTYTGTKKVIGVKAEKKAKAPAGTPLDNTTTAWTAGSYVVPAGGLTYSADAAITVSGDVTLVLTDGETLTLNKGISLAEGATLTVKGNGTMAVNGTNNSTASTVAGTGTLVLTSGTLTAKGGNGESIGEDFVYSNGSAGGVAINGNVVVNGGTLTAFGGNGGSVGYLSAYCNGGAGGAAISGDLTINSGTVTSSNGANGQLGEYTSDSNAGAEGKAVEGAVIDNR